MGRHHGIAVPAADAYRTLWIHPDGNGLSVRDLNNVWLPREGTFWRVVVRRQTARGWTEDQIAAAPLGRPLAWPSHLAGGGTIFGYSSHRLTFVGRDYLSTWTRTETAAGREDQLDTRAIAEPATPVGLSSVFGASGTAQFNQTASDWWLDHPEAAPAVSKEPDTSRWGVVRREGTWIVAGQLAPARSGGFAVFDIPLCPPPGLVSYDGLVPPWQEVSDSVHGVLDAFSAPGHQVLGTVRPGRLDLFPSRGDSVRYDATHWTVPLVGREFPVMIQWAPDVDDWDRTLPKSN